MARIFQCGFELQSSTLEFTAVNASTTPVVSFPTPGRSGITGTRSRRVAGNGFGSGAHSMTFLFADKAELYGQFSMLISGASNGQLCGFSVRDSSGNNIFRLAATAATSAAPDATIGTSTDGGDASEGLSTSFKLVEFHILIDDTVGEISVKFDGIEVYSFTGNTDPNARVNAGQLVIHGGGISTTYDVDDVIINDTTGGVQDTWVNNETLLLLLPSGNGDSSELLGSDGNSTDNYLLVDESPNDGDTTYVAATTTAEKDLYAIADLPTLPAGSTIRHVQALAVARRADPGTLSNIDVGLKSDTTEDFATSQALTTVYALYRGDIHYVDPDDSGAWDETKVNALQVGVESS